MQNSGNRYSNVALNIKISPKHTHSCYLLRCSLCMKHEVIIFVSNPLKEAESVRSSQTAPGRNINELNMVFEHILAVKDPTQDKNTQNRPANPSIPLHQHHYIMQLDLNTETLCGLISKSKPSRLFPRIQPHTGIKTGFRFSGLMQQNKCCHGEAVTDHLKRP